MYNMKQALDDFSWLGRVEKVYAIGKDYHVVEYKEKPSGGNVGRHRTMFASIVDGRKTSTSFPTFEAAVMHCFAFKALGPNTQAAYFMAKMIGKESV